jgi:hypothetical protein
VPAGGTESFPRIIARLLRPPRSQQATKNPPAEPGENFQSRFHAALLALRLAALALSALLATLLAALPAGFLLLLARLRLSALLLLTALLASLLAALLRFLVLVTHGEFLLCAG